MNLIKAVELLRKITVDIRYIEIFMYKFSRSNTPIIHSQAIFPRIKDTPG